MNSVLRKEYLAALGLETWTLRGPTAAGSEPVAAPVNESVPAVAAAPREAERRNEVAPGDGAAPRETAPREAAYDWPQLRERVAACTRCGLSATRTQTVFGVGNLQAEWLVVGEAPGAEEDRQGEPFVGRAGQLLNSMLRAIGLKREQVYIANVLKCRPPQNRDPLPKETVECLPYLDRQIALLRPKIMLVVGRIAAQNLLRTDAKLGALRQQVHIFGASRVPLVVTYHPAYLLRSPAEKRKAWEDLKFAREVFARG
jgi:uracil-DNA glycosylase family 4